MDHPNQEKNKDLTKMWRVVNFWVDCRWLFSIFCKCWLSTLWFSSFSFHHLLKSAPKPSDIAYFRFCAHLGLPWSKWEVCKQQFRELTAGQTLCWAQSTGNSGMWAHGHRGEQRVAGPPEGRNSRTPPFRTTILHSSWYTHQRQSGCWMNISPHRTTYFSSWGWFPFWILWAFPSSACCIKFASFVPMKQKTAEGMIFFIGFYQSGLAPITPPTSRNWKPSELELLYYYAKLSIKCYE